MEASRACQIFVLAIEAVIISSLINRGSLTEEEGKFLRLTNHATQTAPMHHRRSSTKGGVHYGGGGPALPL